MAIWEHHSGHLKLLSGSLCLNQRICWAKSWTYWRVDDSHGVLLNHKSTEIGCCLLWLTPPLIIYMVLITRAATHARIHAAAAAAAAAAACIPVHVCQSISTHVHSSSSSSMHACMHACIPAHRTYMLRIVVLECSRRPCRT